MSSYRPWYKRYPADFIDGTVGLSLEEKGAYSLILDLIYARGAPIKDDARYLAGVCNISLRKWAAIRDRLIEAKKIIISDGFILNFRAEKEIEIATKQSRKLVESGAKGGRNRAENERRLNKNNDLGQATLKHTCAKDIETDIDIKKDTNVSQKKACRLPDAFQPDFSFAREQGLTEQEAQNEFDSFRDYWNAKSGKDAAKLDWQATWRNWIRTSRKYRGNRHAGTVNEKKSVGRGFTEAVLDHCNRQGLDPFKPIVGSERPANVQSWQETDRRTDSEDPHDTRGGAKLTLIASNAR